MNIDSEISRSQSHNKHAELLVPTVFLPALRQCSLILRCGSALEIYPLGLGSSLHIGWLWFSVF